jgi:genome maintenance protein MGM101
MGMENKVVSGGEASPDPGEILDVAIPDEAGVSAMTELMQRKAMLRAQGPVEVAGTGEETVERYRRASVNPVTSEQASVLAKPIPEEELDILPTGEVYASQVRYRRVLNEAFGPMGWALLPVSQPQKENATVAREYALYAGGQFIAEAWGEQEYDAKNSRMSYPTALESVKSNALMRCCKDLGIASECWDRQFTERWKEKFAVAVWCAATADWNRGKKKKLWRRKDAKPFEFPWAEQETGHVAAVVAAIEVEDENQEAPAVRGEAVHNPTPQGNLVPPDGFQAIMRTHSKPTKKGGIRYAVQLEDGQWYSTFDSKDGEQLMGMKGERIKMNSRMGEFGNEIVDFLTEEEAQ